MSMNGAVPLDKNPETIAGMFDAIAGHYDQLNHLLSAGLDRRWRRRAVHELRLTGRERVLDMCTGTADLAIAAATHRGGSAREVIGVDFASEMLRLARAKVERARLGTRIHLVRGDATRMPLADAGCDAAMVAFGIRNVLDPFAACQEFHRVLRAGSRLAILEFGSPNVPVLQSLYEWYFRRVLPQIGRLISRHGDAYSYLPASVAQFPSPEAFAQTLRRAGFARVRHIPLTLGIVSLFIVEK